jgi:serine/threonine protein kinase
MRATPPRNLTPLDEFIESCFDPRELLIFLEEHCGRSFVAQLPTDSETRRSFSHNSVRLLDRHGLIDHDLIAAIIRVRPNRSAQLRQIADRLKLARVDETELKTVVWRPSEVGEASNRLKWVEMLERHLLIRERALDDTSRGAAGTEIDRHTRLLRSSPIVGAGSVVAGARLERELGKGNFGTVWLARQLGSGVAVATKIFNLDRLGDGVMMWRFRRSIRAMALLGKSRGVPASVPRLVEVAEDTLAFSMTYLNGGTLEQIERRGWSLATKLRVFGRVCEAVDFAHRVGIIHRDIKPANILLGPDASPVLVDYDIADIRFVTQLSVAHGGLGTPIFAAPEQLEDAEYADERSDIYSLGRLLHYLLLEGSPGYQIERDPTLDNLRQCPAALVAIVRRSTQWDPRRRFPSVRALLAELARCQTGLAAVRARVLGTHRWVRHNTLLLAVIGTISSSSLGFAVLQRDYAEVQAELAASKDKSFRLARAEQDAARISAERIQKGLGELSELRVELALLGSAGVSAEQVQLDTQRLGAKLDTVQKGLDTATAELSHHQEVLGEVLAEVPGEVPAVGPPPSSPRTHTSAAWAQLGSGALDQPPVLAAILRTEPAPPAAAQLPAIPVAPPNVVIPKPPPPPPPRPTPTAEPRNLYASLQRSVDRKARARLKECLALNRFNAQREPVQLELTISEMGRLTQLETKLPLAPDVHKCLRDILSTVQFENKREENIVYEI